MFRETFSNSPSGLLVFLNILAMLSIVALILFGRTNGSGVVIGDQIIIEDDLEAYNELSVRVPSMLSDLMDRPIFHIDRRAFVAPVVVAPRALVVIERPSFILTGIITRQDDTAWAYIQKVSDKAVIRVDQGDIVDGWLIQSIQDDKVVVSKNGTTVEIGETKD